MRVTDYDQFVRKTTQFSDKAEEERRAIAFYGLVSEIGSLIAAVKKKLLSEDGEKNWNQPNEEIREELGDALWYCFASAQAANRGALDVLANDIANLRKEIGSGDERARTIAPVLDPAARQAFLNLSQNFPLSPDYTFDDYQSLAYKTARTDGRVLLEVCIAVIWQLGAELLRPTLPDIERELNKNIADRPTNVVLGEIAWHLSAMASLYDFSLDTIVAFNCEKVNYRSERGIPTPLHDADCDERERFPRQFSVSFVHVGPRRSRMYVDGHAIGNDLTDNAYNDDGYRFHDVLHLAFVAHLGWSPVLRGFLKRKRKDEKVDEVEDGGRAKVVEELLIKAIHAEGDKQATAAGRCIVGQPTRLFPTRKLILFRMLKTLRMYVADLEVAKNAFWEWEDAIFHGCEMFFLLSQEKQGTIHVNLDKRSVIFAPHMLPGVQGISVGLGMGTASTGPSEAELSSLSEPELLWARDRGRIADTIAAKKALLNAMQLDVASPDFHRQFEIRLDGSSVSLRASAKVLERIWKLKAVDYKVAFTTVSGCTVCTASAIADVRDIS
jgi:NTP pyrophosphatase (non-canonical NTP hydrolase)